MILECVYSKCVKEAGIAIFLNPFLRGNFDYYDDREKRKFVVLNSFVRFFSHYL